MKLEQKIKYFDVADSDLYINIDDDYYDYREIRETQRMIDIKRK